MNSICYHCRCKFLKSRKNQFYCNKTCYDDARKMEHRYGAKYRPYLSNLQNCPGCRKLFMPKRSDQRTCSLKCRQLVSNSMRLHLSKLDKNKTPKIIFCGSPQKIAFIALQEGLFSGAQMPATVYYIPYFIDQNWRNPVRHLYMKAARRHKPNIATVLDWERPKQFKEVMSWAKEISAYVRQIVIIPKVTGTIHKIPYYVNRKRVVLGYSIPTSYAGTTVPLSEFFRRPIHLLGGSPTEQIRLWNYFRNNNTEVVSADGNQIWKMAMKGRYWVDDEYVLMDREGDLDRKYQESDDSLIEFTFRLSCKNVMAAWRHVV